ncbi:unnamed protein product [Rhizophagus irregularis]|nr:unnamed protein product [Rhizophagus irregularis]
MSLRYNCQEDPFIIYTFIHCTDFAQNVSVKKINCFTERLTGPIEINLKVLASVMPCNDCNVAFDFH